MVAKYFSICILLEHKSKKSMWKLFVGHDTTTNESKFELSKKHMLSRLEKLEMFGQNVLQTLKSYFWELFYLTA